MRTLRQLKKLRMKMRYAFYFLTNVKPTYKSKISKSPQRQIFTEIFDLCKWAFPILENAVKTALNLGSWLFFEKRVNEH